MTDVVNNPEHYNQGNIECIDSIKAMLTTEEYIGSVSYTHLTLPTNREV